MGFLNNIFGEKIPTTFKLVRDGDIDGLRALGRIDVSVDYDYQPLLCFAVSSCKRNLYSIVEHLINVGCDIEARDMFGAVQMTPLIHICGVRGGNINVARLLLERGAKANARSKGGTCSIHRTAFPLSTEMVDLLLKYKADINLTDWDGNTVLHELQMLSDHDVEDNRAKLDKYIEHLIRCGARFDLANRAGDLPGQLMIPQHEKVCKVLRGYLERSGRR